MAYKPPALILPPEVPLIVSDTDSVHIATSGSLDHHLDSIDIQVYPAINNNTMSVVTGAGLYSDYPSLDEDIPLPDFQTNPVYPTPYKTFSHEDHSHPIPQATLLFGNTIPTTVGNVTIHSITMIEHVETEWGAYVRYMLDVDINTNAGYFESPIRVTPTINTNFQESAYVSLFHPDGFGPIPITGLNEFKIGASYGNRIQWTGAQRVVTHATIYVNAMIQGTL